MGPRLTDLFLSSQSDERLVSLARAGHERAFAVIVERYRFELEAFARTRNADGRTEDIVQQAFLGAFAALRAGAEVSHLRGWLYRIVRNEASKVRRTTEVSLDDVSAYGEPLEDLVQRRAVALAALSELNALPQRQREALVATALRGSTRADVARAMGLSEGAVRQLVHRARHAVRTAVTGLTPYPLAQFLAGSGSGAASDASIAAGAASAGGVALKLGALLASGVAATAVVTSVPGTGSSHPASPQASLVHRAGDAGDHRAGRLMLAAAAPGTGARSSTSDDPGSQHGRSRDQGATGSSGGSRDHGGGSGPSRGGRRQPTQTTSSDGGRSSTDAGDDHGSGGGGSGGNDGDRGGGSSGGGPGPSGSPSSGGSDSGTSGSADTTDGPGSSSGSGPAGSSGSSVGSGSSGGPDGTASTSGSGSKDGPGDGGSGSGQAVVASEGQPIATDGTATSDGSGAGATSSLDPTDGGSGGSGSSEGGPAQSVGP